MRGNGSARGDNFAKIIYPRSQNLPDNRRASIHEGRLPEAFGGADRGRWSRKGATRTPASRQPKPNGPGAPAARHGAWVAAPEGDTHRRRAAEAPQRWIGPGLGLKGQSTGGRAEQASNTARGTLEKWRTCGLPNRTMSDREMSFRLRLARDASLRVRLDPGVPRRPHFSRRSR